MLEFAIELQYNAKLAIWLQIKRRMRVRALEINLPVSNDTGLPVVVACTDGTALVPAVVVWRMVGVVRECSVTAAISLDNLTVSYQRHPVLHHVNGCFEQGSLTAVIGPNGAGKSTLLKSILRLMPCDGGDVIVDKAVKRIAYMPQQSSIDRQFPISVLDCVLLGYWKSVGVCKGMSASMAVRAEEALCAVGLEGFGQRPISALSVGQLQRVLFARIFLQDADLILLDEPFNAIDARTTEDLLAIVRGWQREQKTVIAVLHDYEQVRRVFPQTLLLARNVIAWGQTDAVLCEENLMRARRMAERIEDNAPVCTLDEPTR